MPLLSSRASGSVRAFGLTILSALTSAIDLFTRPDQSGLGTVKGQRWRVWRGVWGIASNRASSSTASSSYPLATLTFTKQDATVSIGGPNPGTGAAFWVTDANNWYSTVYVQQEVCQTCTNCNAWNANNCAEASGGFCATWNNVNPCSYWQCSDGGTNCGNCAPGAFNPTTGGTCQTRNPDICANVNGSFCKGFSQGPCVNWNNFAPKGFCSGRSPDVCSGGWNTSNCAAWNTGNCTSWNPLVFGNCNSWNNPVCQGNTPGNCSSANPVICNAFNPSNCNAFFSFSCNCVTENRINIISSITSTVTTLVSTLWSGTIGSFKTIVSGNSATIQVYTSTNYTSQIGSNSVQNISSPQKSKLFGIIKAPSPIGSGNSIDEFRVE